MEIQQENIEYNISTKNTVSALKRGCSGIDSITGKYNIKQL